MSTTKISLGLVVIIVIAVILGIPIVGTAIREISANRHARMELAAASQELEAEKARLRAVEQKVQSSEKARAELLAEQNASRAAANSSAGGSSLAAGGAGSSGGSAGAGAGGADPIAEGQKFLAAFPQARALFMQDNQPEILKAFGPFFRQAGLTPGQIQQFENLMSSTWINNVVETPTQPLGLGPNSNPTTEQLSQIIGEQAAEDFQTYNQTMLYPYKFTTLAATAASAAGAPLSEQQNDQLAQIIANNAGPYQIVPGTVGPGNWNALAGAVNWDATIAQAKEALSPAQFSAVQGMLLNMQLQASLTQAQQNQAQGKTGP